MIPGSLPALLPLKKQWRRCLERIQDFIPVHESKGSFGCESYVEAAGKDAEEELGIRTIEVSISDTKDHAMAFAVGEGEAG